MNFFDLCPIMPRALHFSLHQWHLVIIFFWSAAKHLKKKVDPRSICAHFWSFLRPANKSLKEKKILQRFLIHCESLKNNDQCAGKTLRTEIKDLEYISTLTAFNVYIYMAHTFKPNVQSNSVRLVYGVECGGAQILPCIFLGMCPCSPYDRESPKDSVSTLGSMSARPAWAGDSAPLGGTPGRVRHTFPKHSPKVSQIVSFKTVRFWLWVFVLQLFDYFSGFWFWQIRPFPSEGDSLPECVFSDSTSRIHFS